MAAERTSRKFVLKAAAKVTSKMKAATAKRKPGRPRKDPEASSTGKGAAKAKGEHPKAELVRELCKVGRQGRRVTSPVPRVAIARALRISQRQVRKAIGESARVVVSQFRMGVHKRRCDKERERWMEMARLGLKV